MPTSKRPDRRPAAHLAASAATLALLWGSGTAAAPLVEVDIPAGPLEGALTALAAQTHTELLYTPDLVAGRRAHAVRGAFAPEAALRRLLEGDGIVVVRTAPNVLVLRSSTVSAASGAPQREGGAPDPRPFVPEPAATAAAPAKVAAAPPANTVAEIQVTGTHIRGAGDGASPMVVMSREDLDRSGYSTLAGALGVLPQNFSGQATEASVANRADALGTNATYATSINLRGLGADATLVLLNGRRLAGSGLRGDFVDLSTLPTLAIQRVEVLLDGASAVYGSDAVGGVVNVILRRDLNGGEVRLEGGVGEGGTPTEAHAAAVVGRVWDSGGVMVAYETYARSALAAADRPFSASADLRPFGGTDRRSTFAFPGNIVVRDPVTGVSAPAFGIPPGQTGVGLRPADFLTTLNRLSPQAGVDLLPDQRTQSAFLAVRQAVTDGLEVSGELRFGERRARSAIAGQTSLLTVTRSDPFFVSPIGASSEQIQYSFQGELGNPIAHALAQSWSGSLGGTARLPAGWQAQGYVGVAQERDSNRTTGSLQTAILAEALGNTPDRPQTPYNAALDGFFNPFTGQRGNAPAVLAALASGFTRTSTRSQVFTADLQADGPLLRLPAGEAKLAVGVQARRETFRVYGVNYLSTVAATPSTSIDANRDVVAGFAELQAPLVSAAQAVPGVRSLDLSAAVRVESYKDFGRTTDPKVGLVWVPAEGLRLRATYGQSFRAPALQELRSPPLNGPAIFPLGGGTLLGLLLQGGNPNLRPETATSWTVGAELRPSAIPDLRLSATWFHTNFHDRIEQPVRQNLAGALTDPTLSSFVRRISPTTNAADLALITALLADPATTTSQGVFPPTAFGAVVDVRFVNTSRLIVSGLDLAADWSRDLAGGRLRLSADATYLDHYEQQATPTAPPVERAGVVGFPARLRARGVADWSRGPLGVMLAINHTDGFKSPVGTRADAFTSADVQVRLTAPAGSRWAGTALALSVRNLFDSHPPFYDNPFGFAFDGANADVVGRFVSLRLTKDW